MTSGWWEGDARASHMCSDGRCRHGITHDGGAVACREGLKKGAPFWLAPTPKLQRIKEWKLPYCGGWTPKDGKDAWARLNGSREAVRQRAVKAWAELQPGECGAVAIAAAPLCVETCEHVPTPCTEEVTPSPQPEPVPILLESHQKETRAMPLDRKQLACWITPEGFAALEKLQEHYAQRLGGHPVAKGVAVDLTLKDAAHRLPEVSGQS